MKSFKLNFTALAFILGAFIAISQSAFTSAKKVNKARPGTEYEFKGTTVAEEKTASEYAVDSGSGPTCSGTTLVCTINVTGDLQSWLTTHSDAQILAAADQTKN